MKLETLEDIKTFEEDEDSIFKMYLLPLWLCCPLDFPRILQMSNAEP